MFQKTIISKYLKSQNTEHLTAKWELFRVHFHHAEIQENIRNSKEEQYQGEFLIDLFVNVLGYTKNPTPNFNLTTEYKNVKDSKKADGAIIINEKVSSIIELKGTNTTDLSKIEDQAFGYKNNQPDCKYIITSNFEKLRFYIDNAIEHLEFNLFQLTFEQFQLLYLCLGFENISLDIPSKMKRESVSQEDAITKKLYKDYSVFKRELFHNLTTLNPDYEPIELFKKSQKLLDRLLFLFFGEDRGLLPPNSVRLILEDWKAIKDRDEDVQLYSRFKKYFGYLNTGFKGKRYDVFAYNGGLFKPDEVLDNIIIDDELLFKHSLKLADYDFASEVDVNILGHIFENSLNELDEVKAQLEGQEIDKSKTKRKKDGVFYTPKYITKYIVENTVGKLCEDKKAEFAIVEEEYFTDKKRQQKTKLALLKKLDDYRTWMHQITIIDPACGSGAFLNEALNFLIGEHQYIDELEAKLTGSSIAFAYHSESILENNLFGVDLNEESVEIAKLSLWLRTAEPNRKLNSLNDNIKCGNSLIDDPEVAGDKAFNWEQEFPHIFSKGGFDVVIGNPPYGASFSAIDKNYLKLKYETVHVRTPESYNYFIKQILEISKTNGICSVIIPSSFLNQIEFEKTRKLILNNHTLNNVLDLGDNIFSDVSTPTCIIGFNKSKYESIIKYSNLTSLNRNIVPININKISTLISASDLINNQSYSFNYKINNALILKCYENKRSLKDLIEDVATGISPGLGEAFVIDSEIAKNKNIEEVILKKLIIGGEINRYSLKPNSNKKVIYFSSKLDIKDFPNSLNHLSQFKEKLDNRVETKSGAIPWYVMLRPRRIKLFDKPKILVRQTADRIIASYDTEKWYCLKSGIIIQLAENSSLNYNYLIAILNSSTMNFIYNDLVNEGERVFPEVKPIQLFKLPIPEIQKVNQQPFIEKADQMLSLNKELQEISTKFQRTCERKFENLNLNKKLQDWYKLSYADFIKELTKQNVKLTLSEEAEWADYFDQEKSEALEIQAKIASTDKEIDQMVYELYGLSEEEIGIVENS